MDLSNKTFKDNKTGEVVRVIGSFENIAILENKQKVDVQKLMDINLYSEQIDPANFFNNQGAYNILAEKIKSIPADKIRDDVSGEVSVSVDGGGFKPTTNESAVMMGNEDDERAELARKYGASIDNVSSTNKQNQAFAKILGEEEEVQRVEINRDEPRMVEQRQPQQIQQPQQVQVEDPIIAMFKNVKKGIDFKMNLEISNKIPRIDFIEMMEDSYETSIIDFLADDFTNKLLSNPESIKKMISDRIKQIVYGGEVTKKVEEVNSQITDAVTQIVIPTTNPSDREKMNEGVDKNKTTKKSRSKKEITGQ
jgi:hypothetical protein